MTNKEFLDDLLDFGPYGVLTQVFVLEAIRRYSEQVCDADDHIFEGGIIDGTAWKGCAYDIKRRIDKWMDASSLKPTAVDKQPEEWR